MTTISIPKDLKDDLAFHKKDGETWAEFLEQYVDILAGEEITRQEAPPEAPPAQLTDSDDVMLAIGDLEDEIKDMKVMLPGRAAKRTAEELQSHH